MSQQVLYSKDPSQLKGPRYNVPRISLNVVALHHQRQHLHMSKIQTKGQITQNLIDQIDPTALTIYKVPF